MNYILFKRIYWWIILLIIISPMGQLYAIEVEQQGKILTGIVKDTEGEILPGVNIVIKGGTAGAISDADGRYTLKINSEKCTLQFSYVGFKTQEVVYKGQRVLNIVLSEEGEILNDVVVVGYGTQKKVNLTGSVASVKGESLAQRASGNVSASLAGLVPGLKVMNRSGAPGQDGADLSIRGFGAPLILVDGVEQAFGNIDPNEIESISVLKDASATVYGSRAGNGVILITTKRGQKGKPKFSFNFQANVSAPTILAEYVNAGQYAELYNEALVGQGDEPLYSQEEIAKYYDGTNPNYPNTDWQKATLKDTQSSYTANLNVRGGGERANYFLSVGYLHQNSLLQSNDITWDRVSFRSNVDAKITKFLTVGADISGRLERRNAAGSGMPDIMKAIQNAHPTVPLAYPDPTKIPLAGYDQRWANPVAIADKDYSGYLKHECNIIRTALSVKLDLNPWIKGLTVDGKFDYKLNMTFDKNFKNSIDFYTYNPTEDSYMLQGTYNGGTNSLREDFIRDWLWYSMVKVNYERRFAKKHHVSGLLLMEAQSTKNDNFWGRREGFISTEVDEMFAGSEENMKAGGDASQGGRMSFVGKLGYNYANKYLADFVMRADGSPKFAKKHRWGYFPAISVGWRISEERFFKDRIHNVDNLKLRLSAGLAGDEANVAFNYLTGYNFVPAYNYTFSSDASLSTAIRSKGLSNIDAVWANTATYNIGIDYSMWNRKLYAEVDAFYRLKTKMLTTRALSLPSTFGAILPEENLNKQDTRGFEIMLGHANRIGDFIYDIKGNVSWARSKWVHFDEVVRSDPEQDYRYRVDGRWTNMKWGYIADGIFQSQEEIDEWADMTEIAVGKVQPGDIRYLDINGDKKINWKDERPIGKGNDPDIFFGLNGSFKYKNWELNLLFQGATNYSVDYNGAFRNAFGVNMTPLSLWTERWTEDNRNASMPRIALGTGGMNNNNSTFWLIENAYYVRLKNIQLTYTFPEKWIKKIGANNLQLYMSGNNLFTITNVHDKDPETLEAGNLAYPITKALSFGINLNF